MSFMSQLYLAYKAQLISHRGSGPLILPLIVLKFNNISYYYHDLS